MNRGVCLLALRFLRFKEVLFAVSFLAFDFEGQTQPPSVKPGFFCFFMEHPEIIRIFCPGRSLDPPYFVHILAVVGSAAGLCFD